MQFHMIKLRVQRTVSVWRKGWFQGLRGGALVPLQNWSHGVASKLIETNWQPSIPSIKQFKTTQLPMDYDPLDYILRPGPKGEWKGRWIEMKVASVAPQLAVDSWWKHIGTDWKAMEKARNGVPWKWHCQKQIEADCKKVWKGSENENTHTIDSVLLIKKHIFGTPQPLLLWIIMIDYISSQCKSIEILLEDLGIQWH